MTIRLADPEPDKRVQASYGVPVRTRLIPAAARQNEPYARPAPLVQEGAAGPVRPRAFLAAGLQ
jgi:hypothetical protein